MPTHSLQTTSAQAACASLAQLWQYNALLLRQAAQLIDRLVAHAQPSFNYAQAVGPHLRHTIEHYQALMSTLGRPGRHLVDYDARSRALDVQSQSGVTKHRLLQLVDDMDECASNPALSLGDPLTTHLQAGSVGELDVVVNTTLGRELLFLSSHTVHHFALLAHYCKAAGVEVGADFGKAPSTVAFERKSAGR